MKRRKNFERKINLKKNKSRKCHQALLIEMMVIMIIIMIVIYHLVKKINSKKKKISRGQLLIYGDRKIKKTQKKIKIMIINL